MLGAPVAPIRASILSIQESLSLSRAGGHVGAGATPVRFVAEHQVRVNDTRLTVGV